MRLVRSLVPALVGRGRLAAPLVLVPSAQAAAVTCAGLKATIVGNDRANTITGTGRRDVIVARGGNDTIRGLGGNDVICGGEGADTDPGGRRQRPALRRDRLAADRPVRPRGEEGRHDHRRRGRRRDRPGLRPATGHRGTTVELDGVSYANAPAPVVVDFRAAATVPIAAEGNDTVTGYDGGIRVVGSPLGDTIKGTNSRRRDPRPRRRRHGLRPRRRRRHRRPTRPARSATTASTARPATTASAAPSAATPSSAAAAATRSPRPRSCTRSSAAAAASTPSPSRSRWSPASWPRATAARTGCASCPTPTRPSSRPCASTS